MTEVIEEATEAIEVTEVVTDLHYKNKKLNNSNEF